MKLKLGFVVILYAISMMNGVGICSPKHRDKNDENSKQQGWVRLGYVSAIKDESNDPFGDVQLEAHAWSHLCTSPTRRFLAVSNSNPEYYCSQTGQQQATDVNSAGVQRFGLGYHSILSLKDAAIIRKEFKYHYKPYVMAEINIFPLDPASVWAVASVGLKFQKPDGGYDEIVNHKTFRAYESSLNADFELDVPYVQITGVSIAGFTLTPGSIGVSTSVQSPPDTNDFVHWSGRNVVSQDADHIEIAVPIIGRTYAAVGCSDISPPEAIADLKWGLLVNQGTQHAQFQGGTYYPNDPFVFATP